MPPELARVGDDEEMPKRTKSRVLATFIVHRPDGSTLGPVVVSRELPTEDYDLEKAFAHVAASAAEQLPSDRPRRHHHD